MTKYITRVVHCVIRDATLDSMGQRISASPSCGQLVCKVEVRYNMAVYFRHLVKEPAMRSGLTHIPLLLAALLAVALLVMSPAQSVALRERR